MLYVFVIFNIFRCLSPLRGTVIVAVVNMVTGLIGTICYATLAEKIPLTYKIYFFDPTLEEESSGQSYYIAVAVLFSIASIAGAVLLWGALKEIKIVLKCWMVLTVILEITLEVLIMKSAPFYQVPSAVWILKLVLFLCFVRTVFDYHEYLVMQSLRHVILHESQNDILHNVSVMTPGGKVIQTKAPVYKL